MAESSLSAGYDLNNFSPLVVGADNYNLASGERSWFDAVVEGVTLGGKGAFYSAINSFGDTARTVANWFGAEYEMSDTYSELLDSDPAAAQYYKEHQAGIELAGFLGGSIIPGTAGLKAFNVARNAGRGDRFTRTLNLFSAPRDRLIQESLEMIKSGVPNINSALKANKYRSLALGFGDQALQAAVWESSVAATMGASPVLSNADWQDIGLNILIGAGVGGAIGGTFEAFGVVGRFNKARAAADFAMRPYEALTNLGKGDYSAGDRVVALIDSLNKIPMPPPSEAAQRVAIDTYRNAQLEAKKILNGISDSPEIANALFDRLMYMKQNLQLSNDELYDRLANTVGIQRIGKDAHLDESVVYFNTSDDLESGLISNTPKDSKSQAYKVLNEATGLQVSRFASDLEIQLGEANLPGTRYFSTAKEAFANDMDVWIDGNLKAHINPGSKNLVRVPRPGSTNLVGNRVAVIMNLESGEITDKAYGVLGDVWTDKEIKMIGKDKGVQLGDKQLMFDTSNGKEFHKADDYLDSVARFYWAGNRGILPGDVISVNDIPLLSELARKISSTDPNSLDSFLQSIKIESLDGNIITGNEIADGVTAFLADQKRRLAIELSVGEKTGANGLPLGKDPREIAARLNATTDQIKEGFGNPKEISLDLLAPDGKLVGKPKYAKVVYDVGDPLTDSEGMIARGLEGVMARIDRGKDMAETVFSAWAKEDRSLFPEVDVELSQQTANQQGVGASFLGFTNAEYGSVGQLYESIGAGTKMVMEKRFKEVEDQLASAFTQIAQKPEVAAELGIITNVLRSSPDQYVFFEDTNYLVLREILPYVRTTPKGLGIREEATGKLPSNDYILRAAGEDGAETTARGKYAAYKIQNKEVVEWLRANVRINNQRLSTHESFLKAQGINKKVDLDTVYAPPINTRNYPFIALVRHPSGNGASSSSVASLTAASESQLTELMARARDKGYEVIPLTKGDLKKWHEAKGDYDYNANLTENLVDSDLKRAGILSNYFPETNAERILGDWMQWHRYQTTRQVRNMVELRYSQQFAELRSLGEQATNIATSKAQNISGFLRDVAKNPYNDYIKTALGLSRAPEYRLWADANEKTEAFFDTAFTVAKDVFAKAKDGRMSWEQANKLTEKYGLGQAFPNAASYLEAQKVLPPTPYFRNFIQAANSILAATTLRLDFLNSLVNIISTPILLGTEVASIRRKLLDPKMLREFDGMTSTRMPETGLSIPATTKLLYNAVNRYFGPNGKALLAEYQASGLVKGLLDQHHAMIDDLAMTGKEAAGELQKKIRNAVQKGEQLTGNAFAEQFTRFVSADVMNQIATQAGLQGAEKLAYIRTFVNRVQGNYIAAQRPILFQGVLGQAIGLFQTYQFNLMQQMFRHIAAGDKKTVATMLGLQSTLYGFQGLPLFAAVNTHIIGNAPGNPTHTDAFVAIPRLVGKELGDLLLYGGVSWASGAAVYSRGDINPRQISVVPINPTDWPAISGFSRFVSNVYDTGKKLNDGGRWLDTMLQGLEHNAISRPLAGLAQLVQGYSTTSQGGLIARTGEVGLVASAARLAGSKPLNEAIALDANYRSTAYRAKDLARIKSLGEAVKTALMAGRSPTEDEINEFATRYAASGGRIQNFNAFMTDAARNANRSVVNQMAQKLNSPISRNMMEIMGGQPLPDFSNRLPPAPTAEESEGLVQ